MRRSFFRKKCVISNKKAMLILLIAVLFISFIAGSFCCKYIGTSTADRIFNIFKTTAQSSSYFKTITASLIYYLLIYCSILVLGVSAIGIPFILIINGYLAFGSGFAIGCLYQFYGVQGILISSFAIAPTTIVAFALTTFFSVSAIECSFRNFLFYTKGNLQRNELPKLTDLMSKAIVLYTLNIVVVLYESFISPLFINIIVK